MGIGNWSLFRSLRFRARAIRYAWTINPCEIRFLRRLLKPGDMAIDIGAHKGGYLYWLQRSVTRSGKVVAFEPQAVAASELKHIADAFALRHVEIVNCAVSDAEGPRAFYAPESKVSPSATLIKGLFPENNSVKQVEAVTLDGYLGRRPDLPAPRFIKIDVETHELEVLRGASKTLQAVRPVVQLEASQYIYGARPISRIFEFLQGIGLAGFFFFNSRLLPLREFDLEIHQPEARLNRRISADFANDFIFLDPRKDSALLSRYGIHNPVLRRTAA